MRLYFLVITYILHYQKVIKVSCCNLEVIDNYFCLNGVRLCFVVILIFYTTRKLLMFAVVTYFCGLFMSN